MKHLFVIAAFSALMGLTGCTQHSFDSRLPGHYQGSGEIIVSWCQQESLQMDIVIHDDMHVTGTIGDAAIRQGMVRHNSQLLQLSGNPDYVIYADLQGDLVAYEHIHRNSIKLIVDYEEGELIGGFHTSGTKFGGKETMMLSGTDLVLTKINTN